MVKVVKVEVWYLGESRRYKQVQELSVDDIGWWSRACPSCVFPVCPQEGAGKSIHRPELRLVPNLLPHLKPGSLYGAHSFFPRKHMSLTFVPGSRHTIRRHSHSKI